MMRRLPVSLAAAACLVAAPRLGAAQQTTLPLEISVGTLRTYAAQAATRVLVDASKRFSGADLQSNRGHSLVYWSPDLHVDVGDDDAFSSVVAKVVGSYLRFRTIDVAGIATPDTRFFHAFPFSVGAETDRSLRNIGVLGEVGYVPWFQGAVPSLLKSLRLGIFAQGGYKALVDTAGAAPSGGNADQSEEAPNSGIARLKGDVRFNPMLRLGGPGQQAGVGADLAATGWYDIANSATYYSLNATMRLRIDAKHSFDFTYQRGSGAPLFNKGDQWSANLRFVF